MPEHTHDPIRDLENFDSGGLGMTPLEPALVRRLGDRRRARRNTALLAASVVAVLAAASPVVLLANRGDGPSPAPLTPGPSASVSPTGGVAGVVTYPDGGIEVVTEADASKLTGTSPDFRAFIVGLARRAAEDGASCPDAAHGVTVQKYSSAGYAIGGVNACGGYAALWVRLDGAWQEGMGTQESWDCTTLGYLGVPQSFAGECSDLAGGFGPDEVDGVRLGMSEAQVRAAGGLVPAGPDGGCRTLLLPYQSPVSNRTDGWYSPNGGVVAISARPGMKTPEKVGLGSPRAVVEAAYPGGSMRNGSWVVPLGQRAEYEIGLEEDGTVGELLLARPTQDCFG